jgi:hypothetical protein
MCRTLRMVLVPFIGVGGEAKGRRGFNAGDGLELQWPTVFTRGNDRDGTGYWRGKVEEVK